MKKDNNKPVGKLTKIDKDLFKDEIDRLFSREYVEGRSVFTLIEGVTMK